MPFQLEGKVAIVTGAGRGIGREIAMTFAREGAAVVFASRTRCQLEESVASLRSENCQAMAAPTDVANNAEVGALVKDTVAAYGTIDILINAAGANYVSNLLLSDDACWKQTLEVNLYGVYSCMKAALPYMVRKRSGRIINIASVAGKIGVPYNSAYCASKAAVLGLTRSVALEVAKFGITVNAICPWHVETEMMRDAMAKRGAMFGRNVDEHIAHVIDSNPQKRLITATEVAALALFLTSPQAGGINGQAVNQCGGAVMS